MQDQALEPAADLAADAGRSYPDDSAEYRAARTALLAEEIERVARSSASPDRARGGPASRAAARRQGPAGLWVHGRDRCAGTDWSPKLDD